MLEDEHAASCLNARRHWDGQGVGCIRFVFPHLMKSGSFSCPMNTCLHDESYREEISALCQRIDRITEGDRKHSPSSNIGGTKSCITGPSGKYTLTGTLRMVYAP